MKLPVNYDKTHYSKRKLVREEYVRLQAGVCCHCLRPLDGLPANAVTEMKVDKTLFPPNMFKNPVHLHHSHETGLTIGAIHAYCNAVLWQFYGE